MRFLDVGLGTLQLDFFDDGGNIGPFRLQLNLIDGPKRGISELVRGPCAAWSGAPRHLRPFPARHPRTAAGTYALVVQGAVNSGTGALSHTVILLMVACLGHGAFAANHWAIGQTLAGPTMAGRWASIQNGVGNLAGIVAPSVAGFILQTRGSLRLAFLLAGVIALAGALVWYFMVPRVEPVRWEKRVPVEVTR
jgi:hypothetical protein